AEGGIIPPLAGIVGCMQANEAMKYLTGAEGLLAGHLWMTDVQSGQTRTIRLKKTQVGINSLPKTVDTVTADELTKYGAGNYQLIDVRDNGEHQAFNIGGINIPLAEMENRWDAVNPAAPIVCYCTTGKRSAA